MRHHPAAGPAPTRSPGSAPVPTPAPETVPAADWRTRAWRAARRLARRPDWPLVLIGVAALSLNLYRLGGPSVWMDEAFSVELARLSTQHIWGAFMSSEPNMILYYLILHGWLRALALVGLAASAFAVRLPSAIFATASTLMVLALGRRFLGRGTGIVGAILFLLSGWQLTYAQQARGYSLQILLICIAWYALFAVLSGSAHRWQWWAVYVAACVLAVYTQAFSVLVVFAQVIVFACLLVLPTTWRAQVRRCLVGMIVSLVIIGVLIIPLAQASRHSNTPGWLAKPQLGVIAQKLLAPGAPRSLLLVILVMLAIGAVAGGALCAARLPVAARLLERLGIDTRPISIFRLSAGMIPLYISLAGWLLVPVISSFVVSQGALRLFSTRYLVVIVPTCCLMAGAVVVTLNWKWVRVAAIGGVIGASLLLLPSYYAHAQIEDWRTPTQWLEARYHPGDGLVSFDNVQGVEIALQFQLQADHAPFDFTPDAPGYVSLARYGTSDPYQGFGLAINPMALHDYAARHPRLFYVIGRLSGATDERLAAQARQWLGSHYRLLGQFSNGTATVLLYDTTTGP
ncbi:MAG TPA: glycosyltransferase family 39 protein [Ktedonobacterales bacterium]|nr:glycosyltransferase family 39 protein [Ktedonobacterales bacterium]